MLYDLCVRSLPVLTAVVLAAACTPPDDAATRASLTEARLVAVGPAEPGPPGSDAVPHRPVAFRMPDGRTRPVDREAVAFVSRFASGAALVDPARRLYAVTPDGGRRMLAAGATGSLATSPGGDRLAYVVARGTTGELRIHDGQRARTLVAGLASVGVLRFDGAGERLFFVGGRPGGVVGVWTVGVDPEREPAARCLSNCALRTGEPWGDRFVPPPSRPDAFTPEAGAVAWTDPDGGAHRVALEGSAR